VVAAAPVPVNPAPPQPVSKPVGYGIPLQVQKPKVFSPVEATGNLAEGQKYRGFDVKHIFSHQNGSRVVIGTGNLLEYVGDAILNAANEQMQGGGGIDGQITGAGGQAMKTARALLPVKQNSNYIRVYTGDAVVTTSGLLENGSGNFPGCRLKSPFVIHGVGPNFCGSGKIQQLYTAYKAALDHAKARGFKSVGFCLLSSAIFLNGNTQGISLKDVIGVALQAITDHIDPGLEISIVVFTKNPNSFTIRELARQLEFQREMFSLRPEARNSFYASQSIQAPPKCQCWQKGLAPPAPQVQQYEPDWVDPEIQQFHGHDEDESSDESESSEVHNDDDGDDVLHRHGPNPFDEADARLAAAGEHPY